MSFVRNYNCYVEISVKLKYRKYSATVLKNQNNSRKSPKPYIPWRLFIFKYFPYLPCFGMLIAHTQSTKMLEAMAA